MELFSVDRGFIIGEAVIGETPLGTGEDVDDLRSVFTGITVTINQSVENDLFPHPDVVTMNMETFQDTAPEDLEMRNVRLEYLSQDVAHLRVLNWNMSRKVNTKRIEKDSYDVTLTATNFAERFTRTEVDIAERPAENPLIRIQALVPFLDTVELLNPTQLLLSTFRYEQFAEGPGTETIKTAMQLIRETEILLGAVAVYDPLDTSALYFAPIGQTDRNGWVISDANTIEEISTTQRIERSSYVSSLTVTMTQDADTSVSAFVPATVEAPQGISLDVPDEASLKRFILRQPITGQGERQITQMRVPLTDTFFGTFGSPVPPHVTVAGVPYPVLGLTHNVDQWKWTMDVTLGPSNFITREGTYAPVAPQNFEYDQGTETASWDAQTFPTLATASVTSYWVAARNDGWPATPGSSMFATAASVGDTSAVLSLPTGVWFVSLFVLTTDSEIYSYPIALDPIVVP